MTGPRTPGYEPRRDTLDPDERELAERLGRLGPQGGPPAAVDERVLAAAHAATTAIPRRTRRLPLALGVAASLVLALGLAWQLRPLLDDPLPDARQGIDLPARPEGAQPRAAPAEPGQARSTAAGDAVRDPAALPATDPDTAAAGARKAAAPAPRSRMPAERPQAFPGPASPRPVAPAPPPAPPPPPPPVPAAGPAAPPAPVAGTAAGEAADAQLRSRTAAPPRGFAGGRDAAAPAVEESAAAPQASPDAEAQLRRQQLARIRALRDAGDLAQARGELEAFVARWPGYPLPDDLHDLRH